jgi:hypothetical protein
MSERAQAQSSVVAQIGCRTVAEMGAFPCISLHLRSFPCISRFSPELADSTDSVQDERTTYYRMKERT